MADFSKQWCEINDPECPHDFDIMEEHSKLETGYSIGIILSSRREVVQKT